MKTFLKNLFIRNWPRKSLSAILAVIIWFIIDQSLTTTKTINNISVKVENIVPGKTIEGIQSNGFLRQRVNVTLTGNKSILDGLNSSDVFVVFDASGHEEEWIATISRKNLRFNTSDVNVYRGISRVSQQNFMIRLTKLVTEKISITITHPIGKAPKGYKFVDAWPYRLYVTVSGPEDVVKHLKARGIKFTFNLNDISAAQLDDLRATSTREHSDVIRFLVPNTWKQISLPLLSPTPIEIKDPDARYLCIDFLQSEMIKLDTPVPTSLYFPANRSQSIDPSKVILATNHFVENRNGINVIAHPLYVNGVSPLFLDLVKDMLGIVIIVSNREGDGLAWSTQFINPRALEERYVHIMASNTPDDAFQDLQPQVRDEVLRNRFRNFINRFQLYKAGNEKLEIYPKLQGNFVYIDEYLDDKSY